MTTRTARKASVPKAKKTYTLSPEVVEFLERTRKRLRAPSVSSVLEEILQAARREERKAKLERNVINYYDSLSRDDEKEHRQWGEFAMREFPSEEV